MAYQSWKPPVPPFTLLYSHSLEPRPFARVRPGVSQQCRLKAPWLKTGIPFLCSDIGLVRFLCGIPECVCVCGGGAAPGETVSLLLPLSLWVSSNKTVLGLVCVRLAWRIFHFVLNVIRTLASGSYFSTFFHEKNEA